MASSPAFLPPATVSLLESGQGAADATRYLSAAGLVVLLYDHILTFPDEVLLVWRSSRSFAKYVYLLNRYIVPATLIMIAYEMCGLSGHEFTDQGCRVILTINSILATTSMGIANFLVLIRVTMLWDNNPVVRSLLWVGFIGSFGVTMAAMVYALHQSWYGIQYLTTVKMCGVTTTNPALIVAWASPLLYEFIVLVFAVINAIVRPRPANLLLVKALQRDGVVFFIVVTILRALNLAYAATQITRLELLAVNFVWAMVTVVLSRSLLKLRRAEVMETLGQTELGYPRSVTPFGIVPEPDTPEMLEYYGIEEEEIEEVPWLDLGKNTHVPYQDVPKWDWRLSNA